MITVTKRNFYLYLFINTTLIIFAFTSGIMLTVRGYDEVKSKCEKTYNVKECKLVALPTN